VNCCEYGLPVEQPFPDSANAISLRDGITANLDRAKADDFT
jgi:hypothetical protein